MDSFNINSNGMMPQASAPRIFRQPANATGATHSFDSSYQNLTPNTNHSNLTPQFSSVPVHFSEMADANPAVTNPDDSAQQNLLYNSNNVRYSMIPQTYATTATSCSNSTHQGLPLMSNDNSMMLQMCAVLSTSDAMGSAQSTTPRIQSEPQLRAIIQERLPVSGSPYQGYIKDQKDFELQFHAYHALNDTAKGYSGDFPEDPQALRRLVKDLVDAMVNRRETVDAGKIPCGQITKLSPFELELKAWELIYHIKDVQDGLVGLAPWGKEWKDQAFPSFIARYNAVRGKLNVSKAMVAAVFDVKFAKRLALNPRAEHSKKRGNQANNENKQLDLQLAREAKRRRSAEDE